MREPFHKYRLIVGVFLACEVFLGLAIVVVAAAYQYVLGSFMIKKQIALFMPLFLNCYVLGIQLFAIYTGSIMMWKCIWTRRYSISIQWLLTVWLCFCFCSIMSGCATIWCTYNLANEVTEHVADMLFRGINDYYTNPEWKLLWDRLQYNCKCCGVNEHFDWMNASWMPNAAEDPKSPSLYSPDNYEQEIFDTLRRLLSQLPHSERLFNEESQFQKREMKGMKRVQAVAPYACCRHDSSDCYRSYLPRPATSEGIRQMSPTEVYTRGCLPLFRQYTLWFTTALLVLILAAIFVNMCLCCLTRCLMINPKCNCRRYESNYFPHIDDDGNALVVVQCPPRVRCIALEEPVASCGLNLQNTWSDMKPDICYCDYDEDFEDDRHADERMSVCGKTGRKDILIH